MNRQRQKNRQRQTNKQTKTNEQKKTDKQTDINYPKFLYECERVIQRQTNR